MGRMPLKTRLRLMEEEFDTDSFAWENALVIVREGAGRSAVRGLGILPLQGWVSGRIRLTDCCRKEGSWKFASH